MSADPLQATPTALIRYLDSIFLDPNASARAVDKLRTEKQKPNMSFSTFLPKFERLISEGDLSDAPDQVLINYLEGCLTEELRRGMVYRTQETTYPGYVQSLLGLASKLESLAFQNKGPRSQLTAPAFSRTPGRSSEPMDWEPTRASRGKLTPEERRERFEKRLCLYCGAKGHLRASCHLAPPQTRAYKADLPENDPVEQAPALRVPAPRAPAPQVPAPRARAQRAQPQAEEVFFNAEESENE